MLDIIIVNWNSGAQLTDCLKSIKMNADSFVSSVVVVDNGSTDNSLCGIDRLGLPIQIISNLENRGFAAACNQGAARGGSEYLLFLNPDTRLFEKSLSTPLAFMTQPENSDVGICGIQLLDEFGHVTRSCARYPSVVNFIAQATGWNKLPWLCSAGVHMSDWDHSITCSVDHVIGAFYLIRRSVFDSLNGFDELFFVYLEDLDLSLRAYQAGWRSVYLAETQAFHAEGGTSRQVKATRLFYSLRSRLIYGFKHFSAYKAWWLLFVTLTVEPWIRLAFALLRISWVDVVNTYKGYMMLLKGLPATLRLVRKQLLQRENTVEIPAKLRK